MSIKSADDLIVQTENQKLGIVAPEPAKEQKPQTEETPAVEDKKPESEEDASPKDTKEPEEDKKEPQEKPQEDNAKDESLDDETDDYGNPIAKGKTYTEEQVNAMIRDRLARDRQSRGTPQEQQIQDAAKDFKADPNSSESWETQLEGFIETTITKMKTKQHEVEWKAKEEASQAEFEEKFTTGMGKYNDFSAVVTGKPITNSMMLATRSMQDPAAFIYAACKQHPAEVDNIAKMQDPVAQIAAIGRLEERMKKAKTITKAPSPPKKVTGDTSDDMPKQSIDQLIVSHAKSKIMNKR